MGWRFSRLSVILEVEKRDGKATHRGEPQDSSEGPPSPRHRGKAVTVCLQMWVGDLFQPLDLFLRVLLYEPQDE